MPPRKSDASKVPVPGGDDGTPLKEREGVNIEARHLLPKSIEALNLKCAPVGPESAQIHCNSSGKGRTPPQYSNSSQCGSGDDQKRDGVCQLSSNAVRIPQHAHFHYNFNPSISDFYFTSL